MTEFLCVLVVALVVLLGLSFARQVGAERRIDLLERKMATTRDQLHLTASNAGVTLAPWPGASNMDDHPPRAR